jgi:hypothetical protein
VKAALAVSLLMLALAGCSSAAERALLTEFFAASRLRDLTALRDFATVVFEPATDGIVTSFDLLQITVAPSPGGQPVSKEVSISAPVRLPDGRTMVETFVVTMQRGLPGSDQKRWGGWMITAIKAGPTRASSKGREAPSSPRS